MKRLKTIRYTKSDSIVGKSEGIEVSGGGRVKIEVWRTTALMKQV